MILYQFSPEDDDEEDGDQHVKLVRKYHLYNTDPLTHSHNRFDRSASDNTSKLQRKPTSHPKKQQQQDDDEEDDDDDDRHVKLVISLIFC